MEQILQSAHVIQNNPDTEYVGLTRVIFVIQGFRCYIANCPIYVRTFTFIPVLYHGMSEICQPEFKDSPIFITKQHMLWFQVSMNNALARHKIDGKQYLSDHQPDGRL